MTAIVVGVLMAVAAPGLARLLAALLPARAEIASVGTAVDRFPLVAASIVRRTGLVLMAAGCCGLIAVRRPGRPTWMTDRRGTIAAAATTLGTSIWYGWLSSPHNGFATNARFHWVDYLTWDSDRFTYSAARIPHIVFYDAPHIWQGINAGIVVVLVYSISRQLGFSSWLSTAFACIPAISSNLLLFASSAEDVLLNTALLLFVIWAMLRRQPVITGLAIALAVLGRPSFMVLIACVPAANITMRLRNRAGWRGAMTRSTLIVPVVATITVVTQQALFELLGERYLLVDGAVIRQDMLAQWVPRPVEGFTISAFSGVYALHLLWMMPLVLLVFSFISVVTAQGQTATTQVAIYAAAYFVVVHIILHEARPLAYYNTRYLAYAFPFLLLMAAALLVHDRFPRVGPVQAMAAALIVLGTTVLPVDPIATKRWVEERPEVEFWTAREALRDITDGRYVFLDFGDVLSRNYLAYVLRRDLATIRLIGEPSDELVRTITPERGEDVGSEDVVISLRDAPWSPDDPELELDEFVVFVVGDADG